MSIVRNKRLLLDQVTTLAIAQTVQITNLLRDRPVPELAYQLRRTMPTLSETYATAASVIAAKAYNESRAVARPPSEFEAKPKKANTSLAMQAAIGFGIAQLTRGKPYETFQSTLAGSVQRLVLDGDRETVEFNIVLDPDGTRYERVPSPGACAFCMMMAAVVEVRRDDAFDGYHNFCRCTLNPVFVGQSGTELPEYQEVRESYSRASEILEQQRQEVGWYNLKTRQAAAKFPELVKNPKNHLRIIRQQASFQTRPVFSGEQLWFQKSSFTGLKISEIEAAQRIPLKESGIKLKSLSNPDTIENAVKFTNPKFGSTGYDNNCARVIQAYELRRRGFDVTANAFNTNLSFMQSPKFYLGGWKNPITGQTANNLTSVVPTFLKGQQKILTFGEGARGAVSFQYKGKSAAGHTLNWEVVNNKVVWLDAQDGTLGDMAIRKHVGKVKNIQVVRLDDLEPSAHTASYLEEVTRG
jgi:hypothetical protein